MDSLYLMAFSGMRKNKGDGRAIGGDHNAICIVLAVWDVAALAVSLR
jgi:hypothetical protein